MMYAIIEHGYPCGFEELFSKLSFYIHTDFLFPWYDMIV